MAHRLKPDTLTEKRMDADRRDGYTTGLHAVLSLALLATVAVAGVLGYRLVEAESGIRRLQSENETLMDENAGLRDDLTRALSWKDAYDNERRWHNNLARDAHRLTRENQELRADVARLSLEGE
jgi:hypothetical protein